ncbi:MAG TPA: SDR family oxidoreductase [Ramlibacter sp.]|nr:SDR family oxidoreductase [Ramlibacter sp.]
MDLGLKDKIAIVGGGSEGIGYGIARVLAAEGAKVAIWARRGTKLEPAADGLRKETGAEVLAIEGDCRKAEDIDNVLAQTLQRFGGVDIVIHNDGAPPIGPIESFDDAAWLQAVEWNLLYVVRSVRGALPHMKKRGGGSVLNVMSQAAIEPRPQLALSSATWAGVLSYAKTLSLELGAQNINVNTLLSGLIDTPRTAKMAAKVPDPDAWKKRMEREIPLGRFGSIDDMGALSALLVSPRGSFITGTAVQVDGGLQKGIR